MTIGGLVRNGVGMLVNGNSQIEAGDSVMVFCHEQKLNNIEKLFKKDAIW
jgi:trk system potassium uptake protein TrkA